MKLALLFSVFTAGFIACNSQCEENWVQFDDSCFFFSNTARSWLDAENHCKIYSGYLASVDSKQKMDWIENIFIVLGYMRHPSHWLGGSDFAIEGEWRWLKTGLGIKYFNWGPSEPSGNDVDGEDCMEIANYNGTYMMADNDCVHHRAYYVCEKPVAKTTASSVIG